MILVVGGHSKFGAVLIGELVGVGEQVRPVEPGHAGNNYDLTDRLARSLELVLAEPSPALVR